MLNKIIKCLCLTCLFLLLLGLPANAGSITVKWTAPTTNEDGTPITALSGFNIYYGTVASGPYLIKVNIADPSATTKTITGLSPGTYYVVATALNSYGMESKNSNEVVKIVDAPIPSPPSCQ